MSKEPKEAFPWMEDKGLPGRILDANEDIVSVFCGYGGDRSIFSVGAAERVRMVLGLPALIEFAKRFASIGDMRAQKILTDIGESWPAPIPTQEPEQPPEPSGITTEDGTPVFFVAHHTGG